MPQKNIVAGVDVGSTKVAVVIGEVRSKGELDLIGVGECPSAGLRKGIIVDIEHTARAIKTAVEQAERMSGVEMASAYVGVTGPHISSVNNRGVVAVAGPDREISPEDTYRVLEAAKVIALPADRQILHVLPREFVVDGYDGVVDPVGMSGSRLEVDTHIVTAATSALQNLVKSVHRAGLEVQDLILNPLASAEAAVLPAERELGAALVDIGGGTTELAVLDRGGLWFTSVVPVGGDHITSDMAVGLRTPLANAERIKREHGCVLAALMPDSADIEVESMGGQRRLVSRRFIASIIEPRVQEIFSLVKNEIKRSGYKALLPGGVILTGGVAMMDGITHLAAEELGLPVRVGTPVGIGGLSDMVDTPRYATGIGLLRYGTRMIEGEVPAGKPVWGDVFSRFRSWFKDMMGV